jgi:hypothetical protein
MFSGLDRSFTRMGETMVLPVGRFTNRPAPFPVDEPVLHEGVPDHLEPILRQWIYSSLLGGGAEVISLKLEIPLRYDYPSRDAAARCLAQAQSYELLRIVNAILSNGGPWPAPLLTDRRGRNSNVAAVRNLREDLIVMLGAASSVWQVSADGDGLVRRVGESARHAVDRAALAAGTATRSGSADKQIRAAWQALYQLEPEPETAYREAVKAVESAAHAVVQPNKANATLGTIRGELRAQAARWTLAIPGKDGTGDIAPLLAMIDLLWDGQEWRHGSQTPIRNATQGEAEMALYLAVTLVHWFVTGAVRKR